MLCLGIETSCDDTSLALVRDGRLLGQIASSQEDIHALFGGVVPEVASREHARLIGPLCDKLLADTGVVLAEVDGVAVARGPGLLGSLLVGVAFAKALALGCGARFLGVNHLHAHLLAAGLETPIVYPALGLLVSGGHTHLYRITSPKDFSSLGKTLDDAAGEAFDKAGKMLGLAYPAGREMDRLAEQGRPEKRLFPRPYLRSGNLDFSFSGLKTAMYTYLAAHPGALSVPTSAEAGTGSDSWDEKNDKARREQGALADLCASYRLAVVETLLAKTRAALELPEQSDVRTLILAGGVAANTLLRRSFAALAEAFGKPVVIPDPHLCTDNGAMTAYLGWLLMQEDYAHGLDMEAIPRGRHIPMDMRQISFPFREKNATYEHSEGTPLSIDIAYVD